MDPKTRLDEIAHGYQGAVVLLTACKKGVFAALAGGPRTAPELARELELDARALETVMLALAADGFLVLDGERYRVAEEYAPFLLPGGAQTQASILNHNYNCLLRFAQLAQVLETGRPVPHETGFGDAQLLREFICGMADISRTVSVEVAEKLDVSPFRKMLDLGGGPGTAAIAFARRNPNLRGVVFDLAGPIRIAAEEIQKAGISDRIATRVANYLRDDFGEGFDLIYVSNIIHSLGPQDVQKILDKCHPALVPGGTLVIKDFFLEDDRTRPRQAALFSVNMLVGTEAGRSYTLSESKEMAARAGFGDFRVVEVSASRLLIGRRV